MSSDKVKKIIHIYNRGYTSNFPSKDSPYFYLAGWAQLQAVSILKYTDKYKQEIWRPERQVNQIQSKVVNKVLCKLFPLKGNRIFNTPLSMIRALKKELKKNHVILNIHYVHYLQSILLIFIFRKYPIFISHHGSVPFEYQQKKKFFQKLVFNKIFPYIDHFVLKRVDYFSVVSKFEAEYLSKFVNKKTISLESGRKHFKDWEPIEKEKARRILNISVKKKVIVYVGSFYKLKGVDHLIDSYEILKNKIDLELILIGGLESDSLYNHAKNLGIKILGRIPNDEIIMYLSAADVYCAPALEGTWVKFGGISTAIIEALACNIPVISKQLLNFPNDDWKLAGEVPETKEDVIKYIKKVFTAPENYSPRKIAEKHYDFKNIINSNIKIYNNLITKYYGK